MVLPFDRRFRHPEPPITKDWDSVARRYVERSTLEETTFGDLPSGVLLNLPDGVNDNVPTGYRRTEPKDGFAEEGFVPIDRYGPASMPVAPQPAALADHLHTRLLAPVRDLPGFVYLGSPYSLYVGGHDRAARVVSTYAAALMATGLRVYSPIAHGHFVSGHGKLPLSWEFWKDQCQPMIDAASSLVVLTMVGWQASVGLTYEIEEFARAGKPIAYLAPAAAVERRAAA